MFALNIENEWDQKLANNNYFLLNVEVKRTSIWY